MKSIKDRARAYLARMPHSVAGQGGDINAFKAASALTKGFALGPDEAYPLLAEWNTRCLPPWSDTELRQKLTRPAGQAMGYLLGNALEKPYPYSSPGLELETDWKARLRKQWPPFQPLKSVGISMLAKLRQILPDAVDLAHRRGLLKGAWVDGHRCFIIHEGTFAQARRFDGGLLSSKDGRQFKTKNLRGSEGSFIGSSHLGDAAHVLLVEGAIGLLEAYAAILLVDSPLDWAVIASTSASSRFVRDPELLKRIAGRHIRIVADRDEAGKSGASTWLANLEAVGCSVDAVTVPEGCKDLGDLVSTSDLHMATLHDLFR